MISFLNRLGNTWFAKLIFAVLAISMIAFWGLGGISNTTSRDKTAIQVGSQKISLSALVTAFDAERAKWSQFAGQYISPEDAINMGLLQRAVQKQVSDTIHQAIREDLGLIASDSSVRRYVERHPAFQDNLGKFDRNLFLAYLMQTRSTEGQLAEELRAELADQHLTNTIRFVAPAPKLLAQMKWQKQNEVRDVEALLIKQSAIPLAKGPTEEDLKDYYEAYLSDFMQPETRDVVLMLLTPDQIAQNIQISQSQLEDAYEAQKDSFVIPEKRHIFQIRFATKEEADAEKSSLTPQNFMTKAMAKGQTAEETDFGVLTQSELLPELGEKAFAAKQKDIIGPIQTSVGWHVVLVDSIQPASNPNKAKIYAELRQKLAGAIAYEKMEEISRTLEDLLGEGKTLVEAADQLKLRTVQVKKVDIAGENLPDLYKNKELVQDLFVLKEKEATALLDHNNGYLIGEVQKIYPAQPKPFSAVRADLNALWRTEQQKAAMPDLVENALTQMKAGNIPAKSGQLIVAHKLTMSDNAQIPAEALPSIFAQSTGYENAQKIPVKDGVLINVVKAVKKPVMTSAAEEEQEKNFSQEMADSIYGSIIADYVEKLGVEIHMNVIQEAFSAYQTEK